METPPVQCIYEFDILFTLLKKIALAKIPVKTFLDFYLYFSFSVMHMIFKTQKMASALKFTKYQCSQTVDWNISNIHKHCRVVH